MLEEDATLNEDDVLAVRSEGKHGFWLATLDTQPDPEKDEDLEITWFEETEEHCVYKEGEEDDISPGTVICVTKLEVGDLK